MRGWLRTILAVAGWAAALGAAVFLWLRRDLHSVVRAVAEPVSYVVAPETAGRITRLEVDLFQDVAPGAVIAALDDSALRISVEEMRRELLRLEAEAMREKLLLSEERHDLISDRRADLRRFARDVEQAQIELLLAQADQEEDRILLRGLERHVERSTGLSAERVGPQSIMEDDIVARDAALRRVHDREATLRALRANLEQAQQRLDRVTRDHDDDATDALLRPFRYAVEAQAARLESVQLAAARLELRSPRGGRVARILRRTGDMVVIGEPIVELTEPLARTVVAYADAGSAARMQAGQAVTLTRHGVRSERLTSTIARVGPAVTLQPEQLWLVERVPAWGLPLVIPLPPGTGATPGDVFDVRLATR